MNKEHTAPVTDTYPAGSAWLGLAAVYVGFLSVGIVFHFLPPILPVVIGDLGISHGQAGLLMSLFALPGILLSLPGGWLVDRFGERLVGGGGLVLMGAGTVVLGVAPDFGLILLARVLSGAGAMVGVVALQRLVIRLFAGRGLGLPLGISGSAIPIGIIIVLNTAGPLAATAGWRPVALRAGMVTVAVGLVFIAVVSLITRGQPLGRAAGQTDEPLAARGGSFRPIWIAGVVWFCANGAMTAFMTFAPDHFQGLGFGVLARGLFTSIPMWTSAGLGVLVGWLTDRYGGRALSMALGMALMGAALVVLPANLVPPSLIGLALGVALAAVVTPTVALPGALLPASHTGRGYGILATCANLGIFVVPPLAGWSRDTSGHYLWPFVIMGGTAFVGVLGAVVLHRGRFTPGFSRRALVLASLVLLVGCGRRGRYETLAPDTPEVAGAITGGQMIDLTGFLSSRGAGLVGADGWTADDLVLADNSGHLIRVQGTRCTVLSPPVHADLTGVLCRPDGSLLVATRNNGLYRWAADIWSPEPSPPGSDLRSLTVDDQGRPLVTSVVDGWYRDLFRLEAGTWRAVATATGDAIASIWSHPDQGTWLLTEGHNILQLGEMGVAWDDSLPFAANFASTWLAGDGIDKMVCANSEGETWLRENGHWTEQTAGPESYTYGVFGFGGRLFAAHAPGVLTVWQNDRWQTVPDGTVPASIFGRIRTPAGLLLVDNQGGVSAFDGRLSTSISPPLMNLRGVAEYTGRLLVQVESGDVYGAEDLAAGVWRHLGRTTGDTDWDVTNSLMLDDRDHLIVATSAGFEEWDGQDFFILSAEPGFNYLQSMPDGEILFVSGEGELGGLRGGRTDGILDAGARYYGVTGLWRRSPEVVDMLQGAVLTRLASDGSTRLVWKPLGWQPQALQVLDRDRALIWGRRNLRLATGDVLADITPYLRSNLEIVAANPVSFHELPDGGLLAWARDPDALLLRDAAGWHVLESLSAAFGDLDRFFAAPGFLATNEHGLLLYGRGILVQLQSPGGQW